jgi:O-6-methylguanine DNA methyltransferase
MRPTPGSPPDRSFTARVLRVVARIPAGRVATYGDVAALAAHPRAARAVGNLMRTSKRPGLPYHRVVAAGGRVGGYGGAPHLKAALLAAEGIVVVRGRIRDFNRVRFLAAPIRQGRATRGRRGTV